MKDHRAGAKLLDYLIKCIRAQTLVEAKIETIEQLPQAQYDLTQQLKELHQIANKFGLADAADFVKKHIK